MNDIELFKTALNVHRQPKTACKPGVAIGPESLIVSWPRFIFIFFLLVVAPMNNENFWLKSSKLSLYDKNMFLSIHFILLVISSLLGDNFSW